MTNQLTQAELIKLSKQSGFDVDGDEINAPGIIHHGNKFFSPINAQLITFAQLIQQRQGEVVGYVTNDEIPEHRRANLLPGVDVPARSKLYTAPPTASQLVAQALEKAAEDIDALESIVVGTREKDAIKAASTIVRALIDQPVDHSEESLDMVETQKNS